MIEYQRLVSALTDWRARNGLPTHPPEFAPASPSSVSPPLVAPESLVDLEEEEIAADYDGVQEVHEVEEVHEVHEISEAGIEMATEISAEEAGPADYAHPPMTDAYTGGDGEGYDDDQATRAHDPAAAADPDDSLAVAVSAEPVAGDDGFDIATQAVPSDDLVESAEPAPAVVHDDYDDVGFEGSEATVVAAGAIDDEVSVSADDMVVDEISSDGFDVLEEHADEATVIGELPGQDDDNLPPDLPPPPDEER